MKLRNALVMLILGRWKDAPKKTRSIMEKLVFALVALLSGASLSGCAPTTTRMYEGAQLPQSDIAIVRGDGALVVRRVDGKEGSYTGQVVRAGGFELHFLPGRHAIDVEYEHVSTRSVLPTTLYFVAEKGKTYQVKYEILRDSRKWRAWIEESPGI